MYNCPFTNPILIYLLSSPTEHSIYPVCQSGRGGRGKTAEYTPCVSERVGEGTEYIYI